MYLNKSAHHHVLHDFLIAFQCYQYEPSNQKSSIVKNIPWFSYHMFGIGYKKTDETCQTWRPASIQCLYLCDDSFAIFCSVACGKWQAAGISSCITNLSTHLIHKPAGCRKWNNHLHLEFNLLTSRTCWHAVTCQKSMCQALPHQFKQMLFTF